MLAIEVTIKILLGYFDMIWYIGSNQGHCPAKEISNEQSVRPGKIKHWDRSVGLELSGVPTQQNQRWVGLE
jgi:hypothetical protein